MGELTVPLSASKLKTFSKCEERFRLEYVEGYRQFGPENHYIRRGNAVHEAIETVLQDVESLGVVSSALFKDAYADNGGAHGYELGDDDHKVVNQCLETAARFLRGSEEETLGVEIEVEFGVERPEITHDFGGYIDLATDRSVIDWKTGGSDALDETLQGAVYMAGYAQEFGRPPERVVFAYLNPQKGDDYPMSCEIDPSDEAWGTLLAHARTLLEAVEHDAYEASPEDSKCHWCDVEPMCAYSPVGAGNVDYDSYP